MTTVPVPSLADGWYVAEDVKSFTADPAQALQQPADACPIDGQPVDDGHTHTIGAWAEHKRTR